MGDAVATEEILARARGGDEDAFRELTDPYRRELQLHCYRILGSLQHAEDLVQETLLAAWRGLEGFEGRASVRAWLYRIATNRCLNALRDRERRPREVQPMIEPPEPTRRTEPVWLEPYPDVLLEGLENTLAGPEARYEMRESVGLAFATALQHLPPRQRAVLVLREVLGFRAAEVAEILDTSEASVKAALQRARTTLEARLPAGGRERAPLPHSQRERKLVGRFADAVESGDIDRLVSLLTDDAWVTMPPYPFEYQGRTAIASFLSDRARLRGAPLRLVPTRANGQPAFGCYLPDAG
jgi:RNA polymerase sigma-70 factor (ECF subfamily)